jgi:hypothetical protein
VRFLLDENLSREIAHALLRHNSEIDIKRVGDEGAPPLGTLDPDILRYCEAEQRALVTDNRRTMPVHIADHLRAGGHCWGAFKTRRKRAPLGKVIATLILIWEASITSAIFCTLRDR